MIASQTPRPTPEPNRRGGTVGTFLLGTVVGSLAGAVLALALGFKGRGAVDRVTNRLSSKDREQLRFE
ncbi:MAG: hypothetical protein ACKOCK_06340, partial [Chloroflexota bacterium]